MEQEFEEHAPSSQEQGGVTSGVSSEVYTDGEIALEDFGRKYSEKSNVVIENAQNLSDSVIRLEGVDPVTGETYEQNYYHGVESQLDDEYPPIEIVYKAAGIDIEEGSRLLGSEVPSEVFDENFAWTALFNPEEWWNLSLSSRLRNVIMAGGVISILPWFFVLLSLIDIFTAFVFSILVFVLTLSFVILYYRYEYKNREISLEYCGGMESLNEGEKIFIKISEDMKVYGNIVDDDGTVLLENGNEYEVSNYFKEIRSTNSDEKTKYKGLWTVEHPLI